MPSVRVVYHVWIERELIQTLSDSSSTNLSFSVGRAVDVLGPASSPPLPDSFFVDGGFVGLGASFWKQASSVDDI